MKTQGRQTVLMVDDDEDDCLLAAEALAESGADAAFSSVEDGLELLDYLSERVRSGQGGLPGLIMLDLNMPRMNGHDALARIRSEPALQDVPIVIVTTSGEEDVADRTKEMANGFITKPANFEGWLRMMKSLAENWLGL
jgi:CheY-like chemotaxis protein